MPHEPELKLRPLQIADLPATIDVSGSGITVGRDPSSAVPIDGNRYPQVSAFHARFRVTDGELLVEDLDSKNGLTVNGEAVTRRALRAGDLVQLGGESGPRFAVVSGAPLGETLVSTLPGEPAPSRPMGQSTIVRLRHALGLPDGELPVSELLRRRSRGAFVGIAIAVTLLAIGGYLLVDSIRRDREKLRELEALNSLLQSRVDDASEALESQRLAWEAQRSRLVRERRELQQQILQLEREGKDSSRELELVQEALRETTARLEQYDPINLEKAELARREKLRGVLESIVYVEKIVRYRDEKSERLLFFDQDESGTVRANLDGNGEIFSTEGSGSGFCVSPQGWILTNAHVVSAPELPRLKYGEWTLLAEMQVTVSFSGRPRKHEARVVRRAEENGDDLALLAIEPFDGIPHIEGFSTGVAEVSEGGEVRLFGFPLGKNLLQDESTLTASIFSGIVSRRVAPYIQVQAAVYPGNSGGPVVDEQARVIGIVTAVQTIPSGQIASDIGYVIPIVRAAALWPPPPGNEAAGAEGGREGN